MNKEISGIINKRKQPNKKRNVGEFPGGPEVRTSTAGKGLDPWLEDQDPAGSAAQLPPLKMERPSLFMHLITPSVPCRFPLHLHLCVSFIPVRASLTYLPRDIHLS